jgi:hypothetical protein
MIGQCCTAHWCRREQAEHPQKLPHSGMQQAGLASARLPCWRVHGCKHQTVQRLLLARLLGRLLLRRLLQGAWCWRFMPARLLQGLRRALY